LASESGQPSPGGDAAEKLRCRGLGVDALAQRDRVEFRVRSVLFIQVGREQTNDLVKVLTFLTAIVGFCAAIAGLMGMNFKLAFFETGMTGFLIVTGALAVIALCAVAYARYRDWI